jgi:hypothetical protein
LLLIGYFEGLDSERAIAWRVAAEQIEAVRADGDGLDEVVGDKGYHSNQSLVDFDAVAVRSYISEPARGRRNWKKHPEARDAVYRNRSTIRGARDPVKSMRGEPLDAATLDSWMDSWRASPTACGRSSCGTREVRSDPRHCPTRSLRPSFQGSRYRR